MSGYCPRWHMWVSRTVYLRWPYAEPLVIDYKVCERCGRVAT